MKYLKNLGIAASAFLVMTASGYAKSKWYCELQENQIKCYETDGGLTMRIDPRRNPELAGLRNKVNHEANYPEKLPAKMNYTDSIYTIKYFDQKKAEKKAYELIKSSKIAEADKDFFVNGCRYWPFIKFYSDKKGIDNRLAYLTFFTESAGFTKTTGSCGEIGIAQIMPNVGIKYQCSWKKDECWIEGESFKNPVNNIIGGVKHLIACQEIAKCKKSLREMEAMEILAVYSTYVSGKPYFDSGNQYKWPSYFADNIEYFYLLGYIDQCSADGKMINKEGRMKKAGLEAKIKTQHKK